MKKSTAAISHDNKRGYTHGDKVTCGPDVAVFDADVGRRGGIDKVGRGKGDEPIEDVIRSRSETHRVRTEARGDSFICDRVRNRSDTRVVREIIQHCECRQGLAAGLSRGGNCPGDGEGKHEYSTAKSAADHHRSSTEDFVHEVHADIRAEPTHDTRGDGKLERVCEASLLEEESDIRYP